MARKRNSFIHTDKWYAQRIGGVRRAAEHVRHYRSTVSGKTGRGVVAQRTSTSAVPYRAYNIGKRVRRIVSKLRRRQKQDQRDAARMWPGHKPVGILLPRR